MPLSDPLFGAFREQVREKPFCKSPRYTPELEDGSRSFESCMRDEITRGRLLVEALSVLPRTDPVVKEPNFFAGHDRCCDLDRVRLSISNPEAPLATDSRTLMAAEMDSTHPRESSLQHFASVLLHPRAVRDDDMLRIPVEDLTLGSAGSCPVPER